MICGKIGRRFAGELGFVFHDCFLFPPVAAGEEKEREETKAHARVALRKMPFSGGGLVRRRSYARGKGSNFGVHRFSRVWSDSDLARYFSTAAIKFCEIACSVGQIFSIVCTPSMR